MAITHSNRTDSEPTPTHRPSTTAGGNADHGFTLIELLVIIGILGVLAATVLLALGGVSTDAADTSCIADERVLIVAVEIHLSEHDEILPTGTDDDRYERTLIDAGLLRTVSQFHDLTADGTIVPEAPSC